MDFDDPVGLLQSFVIPLLGVFLVFLVGWALLMHMKVWASRGWAMAQARVIVSEVVDKRVSTKSGSFLAKVPKVVYEYQVGGQVYRGERITFGQMRRSRSPDLALQTLANYPLGSI